MCTQERASIVALATGLLVNGYVLVRYLQLSGAGALSGPDGPMVWARMMLWAVPAAIVLTIVLNVLFSVSMRERLTGAVVDERDKLFQLRGMSATLYVFGAGFVASMVGLALGWTPLTGFISIYVAAALGDLAGNLTRLVSYRLGS